MGKAKESTSTRDNPDVFRIFIASDNHLGYMERDGVRGEDSFVTFEEIMKLAREHEVDFVLLGGDLFHDNKPSRKTLYRTTEIFRKYCMGDRPVRFDLLSDMDKNFPANHGRVNYMDENYNVDLPVFIVHGNHDDPAGDGSLSALDLLAANNLINYFGRSDSVEDIEIYPILLRKGATKLGIYGLGNIRDERLHRTFSAQGVKWARPREGKDDYYNIFVIHQNRTHHSAKNYIPETMIANFIDFVLWGHEHECKVKPQESAVQSFHISQPGSSVATSLSEGEARPKRVGILEICRGSWRFEEIPLQSVRQLIMEDVELAAYEHLDPDDPNVEAEILKVLVDKVEELIARAKSMYVPYEGHDSLSLPLIRVRVEHTGFTTLNPQRFGQRFVKRVANPSDILLFTRRRKGREDEEEKRIVEQRADELIDRLRAARADANDGEEEIRVTDIVLSYLNAAKRSMQVLERGALAKAVDAYVTKDDRHAIPDFVKKAVRELHTRMITEKVDPNAELERLLEQHRAKLAAQSAAPPTRQAPLNIDWTQRDLQATSPAPEEDEAGELAPSNAEDVGEGTSGARGRTTRGRAKATRGRGRGRGRGRAAAASTRRSSSASRQSTIDFSHSSAAPPEEIVVDSDGMENSQDESVADSGMSKWSERSTSKRTGAPAAAKPAKRQRSTRSALSFRETCDSDDDDANDGRALLGGGDFAKNWS